MRWLITFSRLQHPIGNLLSDLPEIIDIHIEKRGDWIPPCLTPLFTGKTSYLTVVVVRLEHSHIPPCLTPLFTGKTSSLTVVVVRLEHSHIPPCLTPSFTGKTSSLTVVVVRLEHSHIPPCLTPLFTGKTSSLTVVVVRLEHSHSFIDSWDNHSTASAPASCRRRRPPGNAVSGHSSTMCLESKWCDHAPSVERFGTSGLATSQTI